MRLQILGDPSLMAQLREVWASYRLHLRWNADLRLSLFRRNPSLQQLLNRILPVLRNCLDIRVKGNTVRNWPNNARSSVLMQIPLMWRLKGRSKKLFDNKQSWKTWSMPLNILPRHLGELRCYSEHLASLLLSRKRDQLKITVSTLK